MRRIVFLLIAFGLLGHPGMASDAVPDGSLRQALSGGVKWLVAKQRTAGFFDASDKEAAGKEHLGALTALAVIALHDAGHHASDASDEGRALLKAIGYLSHDVATAQDSVARGYLGRNDRSRMYGHGMMTYALASVVEEVADPALQADVRVRVLEAVAYIRASQQVRKLPGHAGGWRYEGISMDSDLSVSVWQLLAMRAAVDHARATVPQFMWSQAADYVKGSAKTARTKAGPAGGFSYELSGGGDHVTFATTGAGVVALQCCGEADAPEVMAGRLFIDQASVAANDRNFFWGMHHCSHAMVAADKVQKAKFQALLANVLVPLQKADGSWQSKGGMEKQAGDLFTTALAVSALGTWTSKQ